MNRWYHNPELLRAAYEEYGTLAEAARQIGGVDPTTLQKAWQKHGMEKLLRGPAPSGQPNEEALKRLHKKVYGE